MTFAILYLAGALSSALDFALFTREFCFPEFFAVAPEYREIGTGVLFYFIKTM